MLEFALVIGLLAALATGVADAGSAFRIKHVLKIASREGARWASVTPGLKKDDPRVLDRVDEILQESRISGAAGAVTPGDPATGDPVTVEVSHEYHPLFPLIGLRGSVQLKSATTMRYEAAGPRVDAPPAGEAEPS